MPRLSEEQKELLLELVEHEGLAVLLLELSSLCRAREEAVLKCSSDDERSLVRTKLKGEGARQLYTDFERYLQTLKKKQ